MLPNNNHNNHNNNKKGMKHAISSLPYHGQPSYPPFLNLSRTLNFADLRDITFTMTLMT